MRRPNEACWISKYGGEFYAGRDDYRKNECLREMLQRLGHE
jgi:hypothetical protein